MSKSSSRRGTPRSGTGRSRKSNAPGLDIMERDMRRVKLKNEQLKVELEKVTEQLKTLQKKKEDAINVGVFDTQHDQKRNDAMVVQMEKLFRKKSRALQKSIEKYREEVKQLQAAGTKSARSKQIQGLKSRLRECELKVDVLKEELANTKDFKHKYETLEERGMAVNELLISKTIGGPKRFRPKTREELVKELKSNDVKNKQEIQRLKKKLSNFSSELKKAKVISRSASRSSNSENIGNGTNTGNGEYTANGSPIKDKEIIDNLNTIATLNDKISVLSRRLTKQKHEQDKRSNEIKELKRFREEAKRLADENIQHKDEIEDLDEQVTKLKNENAKLKSGIETSQSSISRLQQMKDTGLNERRVLMSKHDTELISKDNIIADLERQIKSLGRKEKERAKVTKEHEDTKNTKLAIEKKRHEDLLQSYREKEDEHTNARSKMKTLEDQINTLKEVTNKLEIDNKTKEEKIEGLNSRLRDNAETRAVLQDQIDKLHQDHKDERDRQHSSVQDNVGRLQAEKDKVAEQMRDLMAKYDEKVDKLDVVKSELTKAHVIIEKLEKAHESVKSNSDNSTGQLQEQLGLKNDEINDLNARIEALTNEKETLQTKLDGLITKHKSMSVEFNQTLNAQKITIRDLEKKIDSLQS